MSRRGRLLALAVVAALHLAVFAPTIGDSFAGIDEGLWHTSERVLDGDRPYDDLNFEYPPLALPVIVGPAAASEGLEGYRDAFELEMLLFDLGVVALLALALPGPPRRVWEALGVYTFGVIAVSGVVLPDSKIGDAPLALSRYDLAVALLVLAAVLAREARRSALWGGLLGAATAVKAFPALLFGALLRGERRPWRAIAWAAVPLAAGAVLVIALGDGFWSAVTYHADRELQVETLGATPLMVSHLLFGTELGVVPGAGGFNVAGPGAEAAQVLSFALLIGGVLLLAYECWRRRTPVMIASVAILAVAVVVAPVLSPQFLLWLLPLSAAVYGLGRENVVLLAAFVMTEVMLSNYDGVEVLSGDFVWTLAARNLLLLAYLVLVVIPVFRPSPYPAEDAFERRVRADREADLAPAGER